MLRLTTAKLAEREVTSRLIGDTRHESGTSRYINSGPHCNTAEHYLAKVGGRFVGHVKGKRHM